MNPVKLKKGDVVTFIRRYGYGANVVRVTGSGPKNLHYIHIPDPSIKRDYEPRQEPWSTAWSDIARLFKGEHHKLDSLYRAEDQKYKNESTEHERQKRQAVAEFERQWCIANPRPDYPSIDNAIRKLKIVRKEVKQG